MGIISNEKEVGEEAFLGFDLVELMDGLRGKGRVEGIVEDVEDLVHGC